MDRKIVAGTVAAGTMLAVAGATAGFDTVKYPQGYQTGFVHYGSKDDAEKKRIRLFYVNPEALKAAKPNRPLPDGTVIVMEDRAAKLDAAGNPEMDAAGKLVPTETVTNVFVQEKRAGWGAAYPENIRNGTWEYAWFTAEGVAKSDAKTGQPVTFERCMECHKKVEAQDFNYTLSPYIAGAAK